MFTNVVIYLIILSLIGIANTIYLSYHFLTSTDVRCLLFKKEWCLKVQYSKYNKTLGVPNSFAGLGIYTATLFFVLIYAFGIFGFWPIATMVAIGFLFSVYFTLIQAFALKAFCTWCVLSATLFALMAYIVFFLQYSFF